MGPSPNDKNIYRHKQLNININIYLKKKKRIEGPKSGRTLSFLELPQPELINWHDMAATMGILGTLSSEITLSHVLQNARTRGRPLATHCDTGTKAETWIPQLIPATLL